MYIVLYTFCFASIKAECMQYFIYTFCLASIKVKINNIWTQIFHVNILMKSTSYIFCCIIYNVLFIRIKEFFWYFSNSPVLKFRQCLHLICLLHWQQLIYMFTHLLTELITAALAGFPYLINKALVSVCTQVLRYLKYTFKQPAIHTFLM